MMPYDSDQPPGPLGLPPMSESSSFPMLLPFSIVVVGVGVIASVTLKSQSGLCSAFVSSPRVVETYKVGPPPPSPATVKKGGRLGGAISYLFSPLSKKNDHRVTRT